MIVPADGVAIARGIRRFIRCFVELGDLPDRDSDGVSLVTYRDSKGQCIKTHQGRKTFAAYCLSSKRSSLAAVSNHFKHVSEGITLEGYYPPALRMKTEVEAFRFAATIDYFSDIIDGRRVFGRMKTVIEKFIADEGFRDVEDMVERREAIEGYLRLHKISVFFADNGSCLIAARPMDARCRKDTSGVGWAHLEPDYISRHASMCSGCQCFAYDSSHREYWERRKDDAYLASRDASNRVAVERYKTAATFLKVLAAKEAA